MEVISFVPKPTAYLVWTLDDFGFLHVELMRV